jgi:hypothetical protein
VLRAQLDGAGRFINYIYLEQFYPGVPQKLFADLPFYRLLLPLPELNGIWGTTGMLSVYWMERLLSPIASYLLLSSLAIVAVFWATWFALRSQLFSFTVGLCVVFSPFNYAVYSVSGCIVNYLLITFFALTALAHLKLVETGGLHLKWVLLSTVGLICLALSYEAWIAYGIYILLMAPFVLALLRQRNRVDAIRSLLFVVAQTLTALLAYVFIRSRYPVTFRYGTEADLITHYRSFAPALDDFISNYFTFFYLTLCQLLPPGFGFSATLRAAKGPLTPAQVGSLMGPYHEQYQFLVYPHYLYFWRYAAGVTLTLFLIGVWMAGRRALIQGDLTAAGVVLLAGIVLTSSPGHLLIKFRPYNAAPFLGYKVALSIVALYALFSLLLLRLAEAHRARPRMVVAIVVAAWGYVVYLGLSWPRILSALSAQTGLGTYPDPLRALRHWLP